ncbi:hypothetical protein HYU14_07200 [Candidatus Woesearchaeota archaeon]|nr:hypothetical protein [Candidatus Woesearchaeota archaeon]
MKPSKSIAASSRAGASPRVGIPIPPAPSKQDEISLNFDESAHAGLVKILWAVDLEESTRLLLEQRLREDAAKNASSKKQTTILYEDVEKAYASLIRSGLAYLERKQPVYSI